MKHNDLINEKITDIDSQIIGIENLRTKQKEQFGKKSKSPKVLLVGMGEIDTSHDKATKFQQWRKTLLQNALLQSEEEIKTRLTGIESQLYLQEGLNILTENPNELCKKGIEQLSETAQKLYCEYALLMLSLGYMETLEGFKNFKGG